MSNVFKTKLIKLFYDDLKVNIVPIFNTFKVFNKLFSLLDPLIFYLDAVLESDFPLIGVLFSEINPSQFDP